MPARLTIIGGVFRKLLDGLAAIALVAFVVGTNAGCRQLFGFEDPVVSDAADVDADRCGWSFTPRHADPCVLTPAAPLQLIAAGTHIIDTDTELVVDPVGGTMPLGGTSSTSSYVISIASLTVGSGSSVRVRGARGLVVLAWETIVIDGNLDAVSSASGLAAGANPSACSENAATPGQPAGTGGGGGGGGGFRGDGGNGGTGSNGTVLGGIGGAGVVNVDAIRGGCGGANGGSTIGGAGGGALQLTARLSITIGGSINVGGEGGRGGTGDNGGGGGGSGGLVDLESPAISSTGVIAANGGGGGGGSQIGMNGSPGMTGQPSGSPATGGAGSGGAAGGAGSSMSVLAGRAGINGGDGGGGGGGGAGYIVIHTAQSLTLDGIESPQPTTD